MTPPCQADANAGLQHLARRATARPRRVIRSSGVDVKGWVAVSLVITHSRICFLAGQAAAPLIRPKRRCQGRVPSVSSPTCFYVYFSREAAPRNGARHQEERSAVGRDGANLGAVMDTPGHGAPPLGQQVHIPTPKIPPGAVSYSSRCHLARYAT
ncbi:hypothetical protein E2C01_024884 [Portunus trituberculatus]|uniref:Uncharacterized protein n=1 Tax=Portunus trituberculatus TaxID=210409 RepID=A0A5B7EE40_PORTR|nr:hypothetical protein [Portunus trituberculatus]